MTGLDLMTTNRRSRSRTQHPEKARLCRCCQTESAPCRDHGRRPFRRWRKSHRTDCSRGASPQRGRRHRGSDPRFSRQGRFSPCGVDAAPDVFGHNLETVPRLYPTVRPGARYYASLRLLDDAKRPNPLLFTKSGLMVGLGETLGDIRQVMDDLREAGVDFLTMGQYLQPTPKHHPVDLFWAPEEFDKLETIARSKGFLGVSATPLTRSSFPADEDFAAPKHARQQMLAAGA